jgi:tetratricopeptide (TPR) repeat protein
VSLVNDIWKIYRASAESCVKAGQYSEAERLWLAALEVAEDYGPDNAMLTTSLEGLAEVFWYQGKHEFAAPICRRLLRLYEQKLGHHHPDVGTMAYNLALLYHSWGKYVEAEPFYKLSMSIKTRVLGGRHPEVVSLLGNYADLLLMLDRVEEARELKALSEKVKATSWRKTGNWQAMPAAADSETLSSTSPN